jgi:hypothetical protein
MTRGTQQWTEGERWPGSRCPQQSTFLPNDPVVTHGVEQG